MRASMLLLAATAIGCAAPGGGSGPSSLEPPPEPPPMVEATGDGYTFRLSRDDGVAVATIEGRQADVFQALMRAYEELGLKVGGADRVRGIVQAEPAAAVRQYAGERMTNLFHCGQTLTGDRAESWRLEIEVVSQAQSSGDAQTKLTTRVSALAKTMDGSSTNPVPCSTRGRLEQKIAATTALLLKLGR